MKLPTLFASVLALCCGAMFTFAADEAAKPKSCTPQQKDPNRHEQFMKDKAAALAKGPVQLVFVGDSITDAWRHGDQNKLYVERWGKYNPYNIGISGDETQHVLWRVENGELDGLKPKLVVMMIGTNNIGNQNQMSAADTAKGIECLVRAIRAKLPETKLLLLGVFPRADKAPAVNAKVGEINQLIAKLDDGGQAVKFMDIGDKFLDADGKLPKDVMPDLLHPNLKGYQIWADAISPTIDEMMK
jgi:beta-glucosidase